MRKLFLLAFSCLAVGTICAQQTKTRTQKGVNMMGLPATESYSYYMDGGNEVKHGTYTMKANGTGSGVTYNQNDIITYSHGKYNGSYSASVTFTQKGMTLKDYAKGSFKNGVPTGVWSIRSVNADNGIIKGLDCNFAKPSVLTGQFKLWAKEYVSDKITSSFTFNFDAKGRLNGTQKIEDKSYQLINGVFIPAEDAEVAALATKLANGQITVEELADMNYAVARDEFVGARDYFLQFFSYADGISYEPEKWTKTYITYVVPGLDEIVALVEKRIASRVYQRESKYIEKNGKRYIVKADVSTYKREHLFMQNNVYADTLYISEKIWKSINDNLAFNKYVASLEKYNYTTEGEESYVMIDGQKYVLTEAQKVELDQKEAKRVRPYIRAYIEKSSPFAYKQEGDKIFIETEGEKIQISEKDFETYKANVFNKYLSNTSNYTYQTDNGVSFVTIDNCKFVLNAEQKARLDDLEKDKKAKSLKYFLENNNTFAYTQEGDKIFVTVNNEKTQLSEQEFDKYKARIFKRYHENTYQTENGVSFIMMDNCKLVLNAEQKAELDKREQDRKDQIKEQQNKGNAPSFKSGIYSYGSAILTAEESEPYELIKKFYKVQLPEVHTEGDKEYVEVDGKKVMLDTKDKQKLVADFLEWRINKFKTYPAQPVKEGNLFSIKVATRGYGQEDYPDKLYFSKEEKKKLK